MNNSTGIPSFWYGTNNVQSLFLSYFGMLAWKACFLIVATMFNSCHSRKKNKLLARLHFPKKKFLEYIFWRFCSCLEQWLHLRWAKSAASLLDSSQTTKGVVFRGPASWGIIPSNLTESNWLPLYVFSYHASETGKLSLVLVVFFCHLKPHLSDDAFAFFTHTSTVATWITYMTCTWLTALQSSELIK